MSRIGKKAINVPKDVLITLNEEKVIVKGKHGTLERLFQNNLTVKLEENKIILTRNGGEEFWPNLRQSARLKN